MKTRPNWVEIKRLYQTGNGNVRELCDKFGVPYGTMTKRCAREGWKKDLDTIGKKVVSEVAKETSDIAIEWVKSTVERARRLRKDIDDAKEQMHHAIDPMALDALSRVEVRADDLARRALQLSDAPQKVEANFSIAQTLIDCRRQISCVNEIGVENEDL